jgi:8-amino-7-oxononanoate synthase
MSTEEMLLAASRQENRRNIVGSMFGHIKQYNVVAHAIEGRKIQVAEGQWVADFASCNYLGLDLHPESASEIAGEIKRWGSHPSWCRLVASPKIYEDLENQIASLVGTEAAVMIPTVTLISIGVLPALVGKSGLLILDKEAHETMYEAAKIGRDSGATLRSFRHNDYETLEEILDENRSNPRKVVMVDGVYSMSGDFADIPRLAMLGKKYDALIYIDDAHGFGVIGEDPSLDRSYGFRGNGVVRLCGSSYENLIYVGGCSKAYSSLVAFVACSHNMKQFIQAFATPYDLSGPSPTASLATLKAGLRINEREGDSIRGRLYQNTIVVKRGLQELGFETMNRSNFPIIAVMIRDQGKLIASANLLFDEGILVTVAPFPMVRQGEEALRISVTAANTSEEIEQLLHAFRRVREVIMDHTT